MYYWTTEHSRPQGKKGEDKRLRVLYLQGTRKRKRAPRERKFPSCHIEKAQELKALLSEAYNSQFLSSERNESQVHPGLLVQTQSMGLAWSYPKLLPGEISR